MKNVWKSENLAFPNGSESDYDDKRGFWLVAQIYLHWNEEAQVLDKSKHSSGFLPQDTYRFIRVSIESRGLEFRKALCAPENSIHGRLYIWENRTPVSWLPGLHSRENMKSMFLSSLFSKGERECMQPRLFKQVCESIPSILSLIFWKLPIRYFFW